MNVASSCFLLLFLVACVSSQEAALEKMTPVVLETEAQSDAESERIDYSGTWRGFVKDKNGSQSEVILSIVQHEVPEQSLRIQAERDNYLSDYVAAVFSMKFAYTKEELAEKPKNPCEGIKNPSYHESFYGRLVRGSVVVLEGRTLDDIGFFYTVSLIKLREFRKTADGKILADLWLSSHPTATNRIDSYRTTLTKV
ncbi:MAG: hypothetical protein H6618_02325 [Deltaproteobacteria bacterium]|nr:hypothetical protein [Deltaproteobacteria bacterium]